MRILNHFSDLVLDFLDEHKSDDDAPIEGVPAPEVEVDGTEWAIGPSSTYNMSFFPFFLQM